MYYISRFFILLLIFNVKFYFCVNPADMIYTYFLLWAGKEAIARFETLTKANNKQILLKTNQLKIL